MDYTNLLDSIRKFDLDNKKPSGTLESLLSDKGRSLKAGVIALLDEIKGREDLNVNQTQKIDKEIRRQHTNAMQLENIVDHHPFDLTKDLEESKARIESNVLELEKERRKEQVECWRDLMFLKKHLMVSLKEYWDLVRRKEILDGRSR